MEKCKYFYIILFVFCIYWVFEKNSIIAAVEAGDIWAERLKNMLHHGKISSYPKDEGFAMKMYYGSVLHILSVAVVFALMAGIYLLLRRRSQRTQKSWFLG